MGCQQSTPMMVDPTFVASNTTRKIPIEMPTQKQMSRSGRSNTTTATSTSPGSVNPEVSLEVDEEVTYEIPKVDHNGNLLTEEIVRRTSTSLQTTSVVIGNAEKGGKTLQVEYAYRSQRGYNPEDPLKANQDKYGVTLNLAGETGDALFGVYDGHGEEGHHCASFCKKKLPQQLAKCVRQRRVSRYTAMLQEEGEKGKKGAWNPKFWPLLSKEDFETCCVRAFLETNNALREEKAINEKLSGTTAAVVSFHGGRMTVCHVGDSRVILGHRAATVSAETSLGEEKVEEKVEEEILEKSDRPSQGRLVAIPLTRDQTCYRRDERERILNMGGEIKSIDQLHGAAPLHDDWGDFVHGEKVDIHGDPPRVWVPGKQYPGCAFTRSFGDSMGEDIGINAYPEIVTCDVTKRDEILVIASDGVFEFLTNQEVIDICECTDNPLEACEAVTKAAYKRWIQHDSRCDDITVIVCFLDSMYEPTPDLIGTSTAALFEELPNVYGSPLLQNKSLVLNLTPAAQLQ
ncbi:protein phosphatase 2C [Nitzschia inconspicua]|uniref:Protein phosphatase 2C n=1 Tax=Nitzschia inconspicua TaxID=303405 RepID=A0A9K3L0M4_9STRA|nr:protein phosphatase 2C [Nitzschia inconspicua]